METKTLTINRYNIIGEKQEVNFKNILENKQLEELFVKNFEITVDLINIINNLENIKRIVFVNCILNITLKMPKTENLELNNCKNVYKCMFNENTTKLYVEDCDRINIENIENLNLQTLKIENTLTENLNKISNFVNLEHLFLNEIYLKEKIDYNKLEKLKNVNFNGSYTDNKEEYLEQFNGKNIKVVFLEKNLKIG